ncbi:MAG: glycosyltransferase family 2 protein [Anaerolineae bacterium]|nr:glycosyltransferase family 2 protein [Anaerolineae bacterium]
MPRPSISAVFPAYNDGGTIASMVLMADAMLKLVTDDYEILVGNDGSADYTGQILDILTGVVPRLRVFHHPKNLGYGGNLRSLFAQTSKDWVFYTDGDAQYDVRELLKLTDRMRPEVDIINGYKISRNDPWHRIVIGRLYHHGMKLLFGFTIRDVDCDFRLIRRSCFDAVTLVSKDGTLPLEMVKKFTDAGFVFEEVPVHHYHRVYGISQFFNFPRLVRVVRDIGKLWVSLVLLKGSQPAPAGPTTPIAPPREKQLL